MLAQGVDRRWAPTAGGEVLAFEAGRFRRGLDTRKAETSGVEFILLSTCNRVELYATAETTPLDMVSLAESLARIDDVPIEMLNGHLLARHDAVAVDHLFRVAAGMESLALGEGQILGQVHEAYKLASDSKAVGSILHHVFLRAFRAVRFVGLHGQHLQGSCARRSDKTPGDSTSEPSRSKRCRKSKTICNGHSSWSGNSSERRLVQ